MACVALERSMRCSTARSWVGVQLQVRLGRLSIRTIGGTHGEYRTSRAHVQACTTHSVLKLPRPSRATAIRSGADALRPRGAARQGRAGMARGMLTGGSILLSAALPARKQGPPGRVCSCAPGAGAGRRRSRPHGCARQAPAAPARRRPHSKRRIDGLHQPRGPQRGVGDLHRAQGAPAPRPDSDTPRGRRRGRAGLTAPSARRRSAPSDPGARQAHSCAGKEPPRWRARALSAGHRPRANLARESCS